MFYALFHAAQKDCRYIAEYFHWKIAMVHVRREKHCW